MEIFAENTLHDLFFACAQQTVIDENAGKLVADSLVQERGRHRGIDATAQSKHNLIFADLLTDTRASFFNERPHRPVHRAVANVVDKILQDLFASRCVRDFGMKLKTIKFALRILDGSEIATFSRSHNAKPFRQCGYFVTMTVPNIQLLT